MADNENLYLLTQLDTFHRNNWVKGYFDHSQAIPIDNDRVFIPVKYEFEREYLNKYEEPFELQRDVIARHLADLSTRVSEMIRNTIHQFLQHKGVPSEGANELISLIKGIGDEPDVYVWKAGTSAEEFICSLHGPEFPEHDFRRPLKLGKATYTVKAGSWYVPPPEIDVSCFEPKTNKNA